MKCVSIVVAYGKNRVIGSNNRLPWHLPADLKHFKELTRGNTVIMGRKTFESIGRPLTNRRNIVVTRQKEMQIPDVTTAESIEDAVSKAASDEIFIMGGEEIFRQSLHLAEKVFATEIRHTFEGDVFFPKIGSEWKETEREDHSSDDKNKYAYSFVTYEKAHIK